jgi:hypothetical protein
MNRQFAEQPPLLVEVNRVGFTAVGDLKQLDLGRCLEPREPLLVEPLARGEIEDSADHRESVVDRLCLDSRFSSTRDEVLQSSDVHLSQQQGSDKRIKLPQVQRAVLDAPLVSVLIQEFRRGCPKRVVGSESELVCFANLVDSTC